MSFPLSPANNQVTLENGIAYTYNASRNFWYRTPSTALSAITSNTFTVLNSIIFSDGTSQATAANPTDAYARTTANTASNNITIIQGVNTTQNTNITIATDAATGAFAQANATAGGLTTANGRMSIIEGVNTTQNTNITATDTKAQAAFDSANTKLATSGGTITGNLTVNAVTANTITANGTNLGTAVAEAFLLANNANRSTTSDTAPANPNVGDTWFDTVTNVLLRYTNDGVSNNWIDISGPQNTGFIYQSYSLTPNTSTINETTGNTVIYTVATTNTADNTVLYWTNSGTASSSDFSDSVSNGTVTITNNSGTITRSLSAESVTEGSETIILSLRTGSNTGTVVAVATTVTVEDTSLSPEFKLFSFGYNSSGQLGHNDLVYKSSPTQVGTAINWSLINFGSYGGMISAIKSDGTLWSWGINNNGVLGLNDTAKRSSPTQVGATTNWSAASGTMAIKADGTLWTWGSNDLGQSGHNDTVLRSSPTQVGSATNWSKISEGTNTKLAIKTDGTLWSWGYNFYGQLGLGNQGSGTSRSSPTQVGGGTNWSQISTASIQGAGIKTDGTLWAWGAGDFGQLGTNSTQSWPNNITTPNQVGNLTNWSMVSVGQYCMIAVKNDGTLWAWGSNSNGRLGDGTFTHRSSPVQIGSSTNWAQAKIRYQHAAAIKTDGTLWTWGNNDQGQLGRTGSSNSPAQVGTRTWYQISTGSSVTAGTAT